MGPRESQFKNNTLFASSSGSDLEQDAQDIDDELKNIEKRMQELEKLDRPIEKESLNEIMADLKKLTERQNSIVSSQKADELKEAKEKLLLASRKYEASMSSCCTIL